MVFEFSMVFGQNWVLSHAGLISMVFWSARDGILVLRDGIRVQAWYSGSAMVFRSKTLKIQNTNTENVVLTICLKTEWFVPQNSLAGQFVLCTQQTAPTVLQSNTTSNVAVAQRCFRVLDIASGRSNQSRTSSSMFGPGYFFWKRSLTTASYGDLAQYRCKNVPTIRFST